jgi:proteic killer suppression protein
MIKGFRDKDTERLFRGYFIRRLPHDLQRLARRKLLQIDAATQLDTLRVPPGNQLEALKGNRKGQHSIRVNDQWRICFCWKDGHATAVEIVDYHR